MKNQGNYIFFRLFLMELSLVMPLIMLNAPLWLILIAIFLVSSPTLFGSLTYATILYCSYDVIRPILYIWALVVTFLGVQDFFAIAFYILTGLQAASILKKFIGTIGVIIIALTESKK